ncbi:MAG: hypothetical protein R2753_05335 [Chitinophagales bacterium]
MLDLSLSVDKAEWASDVTSDNLEGVLFDPNRPDDFLKALYSLFNVLVQSLANLYISRGDLESSVTNFFKTDKKYHSIILDHIKSRIILDDYEYEAIKEKMDKIFK